MYIYINIYNAAGSEMLSFLHSPNLSSLSCYAFGVCEGVMGAAELRARSFKKCVYSISPNEGVPRRSPSCTRRTSPRCPAHRLGLGFRF